MSGDNVSIFVAKYGGKLGEGFSKPEIIDSLAWQGRRTKAHGYQSAASTVTNFEDLRKAIQLCEICRIHFNPRKARYRIRYVPSINTSGFIATGPCDACNQRVSTLSVFEPEEIWEAVSCDPQETRIRARMAWQKPGRRPAFGAIINRIRRGITAKLRRNNHG